MGTKKKHQATRKGVSRAKFGVPGNKQVKVSKFWKRCADRLNLHMQQHTGSLKFCGDCAMSVQAED
jgi:hypothetical protein